MTYRVRVSTGGRIVIPKAIRERLGIQGGDELDVTVERGGIHLRLKQDWRRWRGVLAGTGALQELEAEHRREIESGR